MGDGLSQPLFSYPALAVLGLLSSSVDVLKLSVLLEPDVGRSLDVTTPWKMLGAPVSLPLP